jgi:hypothetical protein
MANNPSTWTANAAASKRIDAATAALKDVERRKPGLGQQFVSDFVSSGFQRSLSVTADLMAIKTVSVSDYNAVMAFINDPNALAVAINAGFAPFRGAIANTVPQAAGNIAQAGAAAPGAVFNGLHNASKVIDVPGFLGALANGNTWLRVAEVTLGIVLVVVGLVKLAPPGVAKNVKTVGKVAALL